MNEYLDKTSEDIPFSPARLKAKETDVASSQKYQYLCMAGSVLRQKRGKGVII